MSSVRYVIECRWSGYSNGQPRVCHRTVTTNKKFIEWAEKAYSISFTDGTYMTLDCRQAKPREKVEQMHGYDSLLEQCYRHNTTSVAKLQELRK